MAFIIFYSFVNSKLEYQCYLLIIIKLEKHWIRMLFDSLDVLSYCEGRSHKIDWTCEILNLDHTVATKVQSICYINI